MAVAKRFISISNISLSQANMLYNAANGLLILGAFFVLLGTIVAIWTSGIRDKFGDERISNNETATARANENLAIANLKTAELEKQNLEMRQKFANRRITEEEYKTLVEELSKQPGLFNMEVMGDPESGLYAADILKTFTDAGWKVDKKEFPLGVIWTGLILFQTTDPIIHHIANALAKAHIPFSVGDQSRDKATIMVGGKPPVF